MSVAPFVLLLSGPSGSGKSTTALAWADSRNQASAVIDMDEICSLVRAGRVRPDVHWDAEAARQWRVAMVQSAGLARTYVEEGFLCVIDVYAPPSEESDEWVRLLAGLRLRTVYLDPSYEECSRRNDQRSGERRVAEEALRHNFEAHRWCVDRRRPAAVIDNTALSIAETVAAIDRIIAV